MNHKLEYLLGCALSGQIMWRISPKSTWTGCCQVTSSVQMSWARWEQSGWVRVAVPVQFGCDRTSSSPSWDHWGNYMHARTLWWFWTQLRLNIGQMTSIETRDPWFNYFIQEKITKSSVVIYKYLRGRKIGHQTFLQANKRRHCKMLPMDGNRSYINFSDFNWRECFYF